MAGRSAGGDPEKEIGRTSALRALLADLSLDASFPTSKLWCLDVGTLFESACPSRYDSLLAGPNVSGSSTLYELPEETFAGLVW